MAKPSKMVSKTLEVIWDRNSNTRGTKSLPRMKEINIDDSVIKVKKSSKCKYFSRGIRINEKLHVCGRKPVKRSLFQEKKKEEMYEHSNSNKSETKTHCAPRNYITSLSKAPQMSCLRSPQISSNRELLERNQDASFRDSEQKLFQTEDAKNVELSPSRRNTTRNYRASARKRSDCLSEAPQMSCSRSPLISSNREILERNQDVSFHNFEQRLFQTEGRRTVELSTTHRNSNITGSKFIPETKKINIIDNGTIEVKKSFKSDRFSRKIDEISAKCGRKLVRRSLFQENKKVYTPYDPNKLKNKTQHKPCSSLITRSDRLPEASQMSCSKSPKISSNREILEKNQDASFHNFEQRLFQIEGTRTVELSTTHRNSNIPESKLLLETKKINIIDKGTIEVKKSSNSDCFSRKIDEISAKCGRKLVKRSLFQENKKVYTPCDPNKLKNKTHHEPYNSLITISDGLCEGYTNREMLGRNQNTLFHKSNSHLFQTESAKNAELSPSHSVNDTSIITVLHAADQIHRGSKSPEIMSSRGQWYTEHNDLDKMDVSGYDKFNMNCKPVTQVSTKSSQKSENAHLSKVQSTLNPVDSEDIIESSEIIHLPKNRQSKKKKRSKKKTKIKNYSDKNQVHELQCNEKNETKLQKNEFIKSSEISKTNENIMCDEINFDSLDIINTENMVKSPIIDLKIKNKRKKPKMDSRESPNRHITELIKIENNTRRHCDDTYVVIQPSTSAGPKEFAEQSTKENFKMFEPRVAEHYLNRDKDENVLFTHFPKVSVIPSTPEYKSDKPAIEDYSSETHHLNSCVPLIEVDQSPKIQYENNRLMLIQSVQSPPNANGTTILPALFEPLASPTQSIENSELPFKIDSIESPCAMYDNDNFVSPVSRKKKSGNSPSPNHFDSAKKRKKMCKGGLRGQFRDLINRKKSEACIREYEKNLSENYQQKHGETTLLNVIEAWKEFQTFVLLCYHRKSEMEVQKVLVTLDKCPKNATKNSIIRIYSPWLTIESKTAEVVLFVGVIHAEVIEFVGSIRSIEPTGLFTNHINGLRTTVYQSEVLWKCNCSKEAACQCLGELSVYNYLQYMISH